MGWNDLSPKEQADWKKKNFDTSKTVTESQLDLLRKEGTPDKAIAKYGKDKSMQESLKRFYGSDAVPTTKPPTAPPTAPPTVPPVVNKPVPPSNIPGPDNPQMPEPKVPGPSGDDWWHRPTNENKPLWDTINDWWHSPVYSNKPAPTATPTPLPSRTTTPNGRAQPTATPSVSNPTPSAGSVGPQFRFNAPSSGLFTQSKSTLGGSATSTFAGFPYKSSVSPADVAVHNSLIKYNIPKK
jgi:hypothetical protein